MNKVIHKSFFKRGTAILLALICLISAICLVPINAASREVTITFDYAYDTGGNIIGFVQYTEHDGYVVGTAGPFRQMATMLTASNPDTRSTQAIH